MNSDAPEPGGSRRAGQDPGERERGARVVIAALAVAAILALSLVVLTWPKPGPAPGTTTSTTVKRSPFPARYAWALMTLDGALVGDESISELQDHASKIHGRLTDEGIDIAFGEGEGERHSEILLQLRPLGGAHDYRIGGGTGRFVLTIDGQTWDTDLGGTCVFKFGELVAPRLTLSPAPDVEIFEARLGFVCTLLGTASGMAPLNIIDGNIHAFYMRVPGGTSTERTSSTS